MSAESEQFITQVITKLNAMARVQALKAIPSNTLRLELVTLAPLQGFGGLYLDPFWAYWLHEGHKGFGPKRPGIQWLTWFKDPLKDPRLNSGVTPFRAKDLRYLKENVWMGEEGSEKFQKARSQRQLVFRRYVPPRTGYFFFSNEKGMVGFPEKAHTTIRTDFEAFVKKKYGSKIKEAKIVLR